MKPTRWAVVLVVLLATAVVRLRLLEIPLERDEGEYAYAGQLMLECIAPYQLAYNMKLPGTYAAYAVLMAGLGQTIAGIHLGLLLVNAATILLVALLGIRLFGTVPGVAACGAYALMSVGSKVMGTQAHATHFVVLAALGAAVLLLRYSGSKDPRTLCWSGLLFGLAFVMKQHGLFFGAFGAIYLAATEWRSPRRLAAKLVLFGAAMAAPFGVTCLLLWHAGSFEKFWFWTFTYARVYTSEVPLSEGITLFAQTFPPILKQNAGLWILAGVGLTRLWWKKEYWPSAAFATGLLFFSFLAVCPGLYFRGHYFILLLPAVGLLVGAAVRGRPSLCAFGAALLLSIFAQREFLFRANPIQASRELYGREVFPEAIPVSNYIRAHSGDSSRIAVLGSEPEIYFYAGRLSATTYIYMYSLMESQPYAPVMQVELIREVTAAAPEFVVEVGGDASWQKLPAPVFAWWAGYQRLHYHVVGIADIISDDHTEYRWDAGAQGYHPRSSTYLALYRRNNTVAESSLHPSK